PARNRGCVGPIDSLPGNFDHVLGDVHALRDHVEVRARRADDPQGRIELDAGAAADGGDPERGAVLEGGKPVAQYFQLRDVPHEPGGMGLVAIGVAYVVVVHEGAESAHQAGIEERRGQSSPDEPQRPYARVEDRGEHVHRRSWVVSYRATRTRTACGQPRAQTPSRWMTTS